MKYLAFLRAINVGGKNKITKDEQIALFEDVGGNNVDAYLNTGNIVFSTEEPIDEINTAVEEQLSRKFGTDMPVMIFLFDIIENLVANPPFEGEEPADGYRWYATLLRDTTRTMEIPSVYSISTGDYQFIHQQDGVVFTVLKRKKAGASPNAYLERTLETFCTTRNWNTMQRIVERWA